MARALPPLNALRAFEAAARQLSMSRAAEELGVTHGAVSRQVRLLEQALGVRLFERLNRRIALTAAGRELLQETAAALDRLAEAAARLRGTHGRAPLVVSCIATFAMRWLIPRLPEFHARHPEVEVVLTSPDSPVERPRGDADVALRIGPLQAPPGSLVEPFLAERTGPVLSPSLAGASSSLTPAGLALLPRLHTRSRPGAWADWSRAAGVEVPEVEKGRLFETFYFLLQAAEAGLGVAIGPLQLVAADLAAGRLAAPFGFVASGRAMLLVRPATSRGEPRIEAFRDWLLDAGRRWEAATAAL